jgi:hypothetical protein
VVGVVPQFRLACVRSSVSPVCAIGNVAENSGAARFGWPPWSAWNETMKPVAVGAGAGALAVSTQ